MSVPKLSLAATVVAVVVVGASGFLASPTYAVSGVAVSGASLVANAQQGKANSVTVQQSRPR